MPPFVPASPSRRPPLTHFLCLPLNTSSSTPHLRAALQDFALDVAKDRDAGDGSSRSANGPRDTVKNGVNGGTGAQRTIPPRAVRPPGAIHLTIGVMSLLTPERIKAACDFLEGLDVKTIIAKVAATANTSTQSTETRPSSRNEQQTEKKRDELSLSAKNKADHSDHSSASSSLPDAPPIRIALTSLLPMQLPERTSTLYAAPTPQQPILLPFAQTLHDAFVEAGYLLPPPSIPVRSGKRRGQVDRSRPRELKLHATIVNTIYAGKEKEIPPSFPTSSSRQTEFQSSFKKKQLGVGSGGAELAKAEEMGCSITASAQVGGSTPEGEQGEGDEGETNVIDNNEDDDGDMPEQSWKASNQPRSKRNRKILLDARNVIDRYRDHVWIPEFRLDRVAICEMGARKVYADSEAKKGHGDTEHSHRGTAKGKGSVMEKQVVDEVYVEVFVVNLP